MREIVKKLDACRARISMLCGMDVIVVVDHGRNKVEKFRGKVRDLYDAVFTVASGDKLSCFSYSDVLTKNVRFLKPREG